ncbi:hypothetical protein HanRHA438_Chr07g0308851 [Helianthus annuus]|nr:hypothetical protein HanRHA438_Chr07g0308851 [Helianthus annuus]
MPFFFKSAIRSTRKYSSTTLNVTAIGRPVSIIDSRLTLKLVNSKICVVYICIFLCKLLFY